MSLLKTAFSYIPLKTFDFVINRYAFCLKLWNYISFLIECKEPGLKKKKKKQQQVLAIFGNSDLLPL